MNIHEYQAKELLKSYNVPVPEGRVAFTVEQAAQMAEDLGGERWVVKAQIHAGGRGKAGGVQFANSIAEVRHHANKLIGSHLVTHQTGNQGSIVHRLLIERPSKIAKELYLGFVVDRAAERFTMIASEAGGMDIEEVAKETPEKIIKETIDPAVGLLDFQCRKVASAIGLKDAKMMQKLTKIMQGIYRLLRDKDGILAEINPLVITADNDLICLDAKINFDDNALGRRNDVANLRDFDEEDPKEIEASGHGLNYIALDGNVGCIVNGAGLAMATMDAISFHGGRPANFLDVGGGASPEKVENAFRIVLEDPNVKMILINIFAGINRCDWIATGIVQAIRKLDIKVPIVTRLAGTNVEEGSKILDESGFPFIKTNDLNEAAQKSVEVAKGVSAK
jgi:succinyl-CoA synthetase beta subunit/malate-CoA ligase subunit beta